MSNGRVQAIADLYTVAMESTVGIAEKIPDDKRMTQAGDGKAHSLWLLGHLAFLTGGAVNAMALGGDFLAPREYNKMFAPDMMGGDPITADASTYPSWDEVLATYKKAMSGVIENIKGLEDSDLDGAGKGNYGDEFKDFFANLNKTLIGMALHDAHHRGQMAMLSSGK